MMNSNALYRSHLMQQFATVARSQSRPPIALSRASLARRDSFVRAPPEQVLPVSATQRFEQRNFSRSSSSILHEDGDDRESLKIAKKAAREQEDFPEDSQEFDESNGTIENSTTRASSFQSLMSTRRTVSSIFQLNQDLRPAMDRAILSAQNAPNHMHTTERCIFKRLLSPAAIDAISEIAYHVTFQRRLIKDPEGAVDFAERRKKKWSQIPAYLVALVENQPDQEPENGEATPYDELPFVPPVTEFQLEDHAASYAAVHNILSSLHAEKIGTKLATGPILKTSAFRELIGAKATDRVVAMVMVGYSGRTSQAPMRQSTTLVQDL